MDMALTVGGNLSRFVAFVAVFTALVTVFDVVLTLPGFYSGIWDSWVFLLSPLIGALLGPLAGGLAVGFGSLLGHLIIFRDPYELLFMLGAPVGSAMAALVYQQRWRPVLIGYTALLVGYFLTPVSWVLPLIGIWDTLAGYGFVLLFTICATQNFLFTEQKRSQLLRLLFCTIIGLEADILFRIFILIPGQTYWLFYRMTPEALYYLWLGAGFITPVKVTLAATMTITVGFSLLQLLPRLGIPLTEEP